MGHLASKVALLSVLTISELTEYEGRRDGYLDRYGLVRESHSIQPGH